MSEKTVTVGKSFDARQVAFFVQTASKYVSRIMITIDNKTVNAKSIMGIISLGISQGQQVTIAAEGDDAVQAADEIATVLA